MEKYKVLLCEDDINLGNVLKVLLEQNNYEVTIARDGKEGLAYFKKQTFSICLLDVMMPKMDGFMLAEKITLINPNIPFIFLTAKNVKDDIIKGYKLGANDYITKPFDSEVLMMKIKAILTILSSVSKQTVRTKYQIGKYIFDIKFRKLVIGKREITLSPKETTLLQLLCEKKNDLLERNEGLIKIWGSEAYFNSRSMDVFITKLRQYLRHDPKIHIQNIHGTGFRLIDT